eukprot:Gb_08358 [translate_table: standard]
MCLETSKHWARNVLDNGENVSGVAQEHAPNVLMQYIYQFQVFADKDVWALSYTIVYNLAANFSRELADYIIYIIDVSGGDKIPRKGGPGITQADLLVINKTDLAPAVGADLKVMERDALRMRDGGPFIFAQGSSNASHLHTSILAAAYEAVNVFWLLMNKTPRL